MTMTADTARGPHELVDFGRGQVLLLAGLRDEKDCSSALTGSSRIGLKFIGGYGLREEPYTDPYVRFCGQTEAAAASSDPMYSPIDGRACVWPPAIRKRVRDAVKSFAEVVRYRHRACDDVGVAPRTQDESEHKGCRRRSRFGDLDVSKWFTSTATLQGLFVVFPYVKYFTIFLLIIPYLTLDASG